MEIVNQFIELIPFIIIGGILLSIVKGAVRKIVEIGLCIAGLYVAYQVLMPLFM